MLTRLLLVGAVAAGGALVGASAAHGTTAPGQPARQSLVTEPTVAPDFTFHPVTPCRIVDTRAFAPIASKATKTYLVGGTTGFVGQGGKSGGCGIPVGSASIAASLTAVSATNAGYLRAWPADGAEPTATLLNFAKGASTETGATVSIATGSASALKVKGYGGPTDLVIDVTGYYTEQLHATVSASGIGTGSSHFTGFVHYSTGVYVLGTDRDVSHCGIAVTPLNSSEYASGTPQYMQANNVVVSDWALNSSTHVEQYVDDVLEVVITC